MVVLGRGGWWDGIEGEIGWGWFHMCTSMITPTVYKNVQSPFEPRGFDVFVSYKYGYIRSFTMQMTYVVH